ncbi:MAG: ATP-binding protein [Granulosicoccus sp.]
MNNGNRSKAIFLVFIGSTADNKNMSKDNPSGHDANTIHVLLVEDSQYDREIVAHLIENSKINIVLQFATNRSEALAALKDSNVDCVLLDCRLGNEDGIAILCEIKNLAPFCPVILMTDQGSEAIAAQSIKLGASDYLTKEKLTAAKLCASIEKAISLKALESNIADQLFEQRRFLNVLVHDLRAPLRKIDVIGEFIQEEADSGNLANMNELIITQRLMAKRAAELISSLESYVLLDGDVSFEHVNLTDIAYAACDNLSTFIASRTAHVKIEQMPILNGDESLLTQLIQNLVQNGIKYNENKHPFIHIKTESEREGQITLIVKDNGIGIPQQHLSIIFNPLTRLWGKDQYDGTGLGLAICQKIVGRHGGTMSCTSTEGAGSEFRIRLPKS